jgi:hypothetical protein
MRFHTGTGASAAAVRYEMCNVTRWCGEEVEEERREEDEEEEDKVSGRGEREREREDEKKDLFTASQVIITMSDGIARAQGGHPYLASKLAETKSQLTREERKSVT